MPRIPFTPDDLRAILRDLRSKLDIEKRGIDLALTTSSDQEASQWREVLEGEGLSYVEDAGSSA
jgi:hypothetical protein